MEGINDVRRLATAALRGHLNLNERDLAQAVLNLCDVLDPPDYSLEMELLERAGR